ncbi:5-formyltetrahydrofolate cyclo-ligase [Alteromonas facilis]|uniref:5-formyltetrahydrofolate cyclo-ligase n=1 Tax=Alteromonas facilis TaxID=2048004 RepID=UPI0013DAE2DE|nr:5-formyltetrahydrofolate cyclo-ligase [Alteromonas facilis]
MNKELKRALRAQYRAARNALTADQQSHAAQQLCLQFTQAIQLQSEQHVGVYIANDGELSLSAVITQCWAKGINTYLPVLNTQQDGFLYFIHYHQDSPMQINRFGIPEPEFDKNSCITVENIDVLLMPLVAFDTQGKRLGMGGGFYDRTLAELGQSNKPSLIGIAHDCQESEYIPDEPWDIPLNHILTPTRFLTF